MSNLEILLEGVEVEWKTLGEVLVRTKGTSITAGQMKELHKDGAPLKIFAGGKTIAFFDYDDIPSKDINREPSIIVKSRGVIEFEYYNKPFSHKNEMWSYNSADENINIKFVYYFLKIKEPYFQHIAGRMQMPQISIPDTDKYQIPIPPLQVQKEIVRILDTFTELTAELTARKKQYDYYREQLLSFEDGEVEWKTLGELFDLKNGYTPSKSNIEYWKDGSIPWFRMEDIRQNGRILGEAIQKVSKSAIKGSKLFKENSIIISTSATIGEYALITTPFLCNQRFTCLFLKNEFENIFEIKFLFYYSFVISEWCKNNITIGNFAGVDMVGFKKILIPIPSFSEQKRIVSILDKFEILTTSISEGLPKEIDLRKKQYEYYRDLLLTFPHKETV
jgi:type I restriction enzyme S subunit